MKKVKTYNFKVQSQLGMENQKEIIQVIESNLPNSNNDYNTVITNVIQSVDKRECILSDFYIHPKLTGQDLTLAFPDTHKVNEFPLHLSNKCDFIASKFNDKIMYNSSEVKYITSKNPDVISSLEEGSSYYKQTEDILKKSSEMRTVTLDQISNYGEEFIYVDSEKFSYQLKFLSQIFDYLCISGINILNIVVSNIINRYENITLICKNHETFTSEIFVYLLPVLMSFSFFPFFLYRRNFICRDLLQVLARHLKSNAYFQNFYSAFSQIDSLKALRRAISSVHLNLSYISDYLLNVGLRLNKMPTSKRVFIYIGIGSIFCSGIVLWTEYSFINNIWFIKCYKEFLKSLSIEEAMKLLGTGVLKTQEFFKCFLHNMFFNKNIKF